MSIFYQIRREYELSGLSEQDLTESPFQLFDRWLQQTMQIKEISDPTAMIIATVNEQGQPSQRTVLMKAATDSALVFYTNKNSQKGQDLTTNPNISAIFPWLAAERQVIFQGKVEPLSEQENDAYFYSRPFSSQVAAVISQQSQTISSRDELEQKYHHALAEHPTEKIQRPSHWGGYRINCHSVEFWQGGEYRLHDRFIYRKKGQQWQVSRLQP
ncbi:pyridoxamine 5'-phosphate oxidase [Gayadomonas joobiniege]|uniref:pyridoxamine 5'-phosphate oxidase n=1 Tax=Gayadomonas joobiniege TaxID=1234606 RepID=UPI00036839C0|nr:pyridoxamine 5'-phosphate oxidase [Gayadomonas joobiniege]